MCQRSANPKTTKNPTTDRPDISINIWLNGTFEVPILCASIGCRNLCRMVTQIRHLGVSGARWSSGRHGWIVFCVHLSYFNLECLSHLIFILIPLWRGFQFSEDVLSDVHTEDVSYRRTKPWWGLLMHAYNQGVKYINTIICLPLDIVPMILP